MFNFKKSKSNNDYVDLVEDDLLKIIQDLENRLHAVESKTGLIDPDEVKPKVHGTWN